MLISLEFIQTRLENWNTEIHFNGFHNTRYETVRLYVIGAKPEKGILWFCGPETNPEAFSIDNWKGNGLIWTGAPEEAPSALPVLCAKTAGKTPELFNTICAIFSFYQKWSRELYQAVLKRQSLESLFTLLNKVTPNPWYLSDSSFRMLVIKKDQDMEEMSAIWRYQYYHRHLPIHVILNMVEYGELDQMNSRHHAYIPDSKSFNVPFVSKTIFSEKGILGHFYIIGIYTKPGIYETEIAEFFGNILTELLIHDKTYLPTHGRFYDNYFIDLIEGTEFKGHEEVLQEIFQILSWGNDDLFYIAVFQRFVKDPLEKTVNQLELQILEERAYCKAFSYKDNVVAIFDQSKLRSTGPDHPEIKQDVSIILRDFGGYAGISESFRGTDHFREFNNYYLQASIALEYAIKSEKTSCMCSYKSIAINYLCKELSNRLPACMICHPALDILRQYDRKNGTELCQTLHQYLLHEQNITQSANALYIHRNSLMYRLEKIRQLTGADCSAPEERVRLLLSYYLCASDEDND